MCRFLALSGAQNLHFQSKKSQNGFDPKSLKSQNGFANHPSRLWKRPTPFLQYLALLGAKYMRKNGQKNIKK